MSFKSTEHEFEMGSDVVHITEFPFYPSERTTIAYKPYGDFNYISLFGDPENEQTLFLQTDDSVLWIKANYTFLQQLEDAIKKYRETWSDYDFSNQTITEEE